MEKKEEISKPSHTKDNRTAIIGTPKVMESAENTFKKAKDKKK